MAADKDRGGPGSASAEIEKYLDVLAKDPNSRVFAPLADAYRKAGLLDDAVETALEGLKVHPNYLGGRVALGRAYFAKKQYAEAAAEMQQVVKVASDNIAAHKVLGQIAYEKGDLPSAEKAFRMVQLLDPRDAEAKEILANIAGGAPPPAAALAPPVPRPSATPPVAPPPSVDATPPRPAPPPAMDILAGPAPPARPAAPPPMEIPPPPAAFREPAPPAAEELPELAIDDISLEPPGGDLGEPAPPAAPSPPEELFEVPAVEVPESAPEPPLPVAAAPTLPAASPSPEPAPADMELEVFSRVAYAEEHGRLEPPGGGTAGPPAGAEESPFEVFGRPKRERPVQTTKGEREAFAEIELEPTAHAPVEAQAEAEAESPFEIFTREPRGVRAPEAPREGRGERSSLEELELETTAYMPPPVPPGGAPAVVSLEDEIPRIDLQSEMEAALLAEVDGVQVRQPVPVAEAPVPEPARLAPPAAAEPAAAERVEAVLDSVPAQEPVSPEPEPGEEARGAEPVPQVEEEPALPDLPTAEEAAVPEPAAEEELQLPEPEAEEELPLPEPEAEKEPASALELEAVGDELPPLEPQAPEEPPPLSEAELASRFGFVDVETPPVETPPLEIPAVEIPPPGPPAGAPADSEPLPAAEAEWELTPEAPADLPAPPPQTADVFTLEEEIPNVDLAGEIPAEPVEEAPSPAPPPAPAPPSRGVFDTETLAGIYVNQGFYGRAAEIYERLLEEHPGDAALAARLEEIRAMERGLPAQQAGGPAPGAAPAPAAAASGARGSEETIRRLNTLLEAFRGGRPR